MAETILPVNGVIYLIASRNGQDMDGCVYAITVKVYDFDGLFASRSIDVLVPHDQAMK